MSPDSPPNRGYGDGSEDERERGPAPLHDLTAFQLVVLKVVRDIDADEPIGQEVCAEAEIELNTGIEPGRFYPNISYLEGEGLLERHDANSHGKVVSITDYGREQVAARAEWWRGEQTQMGGRR